MKKILVILSLFLSSCLPYYAGFQVVNAHKEQGPNYTTTTYYTSEDSISYFKIHYVPTIELYLL